MILSTLPKTWILDLDGTLVKHNGYRTDGVDTVLPGAREYLDRIPREDTVVILTSRTEEYREMTEAFLARLWRLEGGADQQARGGPGAVHVAALAHGDAIHLAPDPIRPHLRGCPSRGGPVRLEMPSEMEIWSICL